MAESVFMDSVNDIFKEKVPLPPGPHGYLSGRRRSSRMRLSASASGRRPRSHPAFEQLVDIGLGRLFRTRGRQHLTNDQPRGCSVIGVPATAHEIVDGQVRVLGAGIGDSEIIVLMRGERFLVVRKQRVQRRRRWNTLRNTNRRQRADGEVDVHDVMKPHDRISVLGVPGISKVLLNGVQAGFTQQRQAAGTTVGIECLECPSNVGRRHGVNPSIVHPAYGSYMNFWMLRRSSFGRFRRASFSS